MPAFRRRGQQGACRANLHCLDRPRMVDVYVNVNYGRKSAGPETDLNLDESPAITASPAGRLRRLPMRCQRASVDALPVRNRLALEFDAQRAIVGQDRLHRVPEARAVVHHAQMAQFVGHHIVDHRRTEMHQPPVQADRTIRAGAAPAGASVGQAQLLPAHPELRCEVVESLDETAVSLTHQPGLHRVADLRCRGTMRQGDKQHPARLIRVKLRTGRLEAVARIQHQPHGLTKVGNRRAVAPLDARGLDAPQAFTRLAELAHDPAGLLQQRSIHFVQRHPGRRAHSQTIGPDRKTDGAPLAAAELVADMGAAQGDGPVGARMDKALRRQQVLQGRARHRARRCSINSVQRPFDAGTCRIFCRIRPHTRRSAGAGALRHRWRCAKQIQRELKQRAHHARPP
jgi:hypothetical protein